MSTASVVTPASTRLTTLIALELGGSNDIRNLWPQPKNTKPWNNKAKNQLEARLHSMVCNGTISLGEAQQAIAHDWIAAYQRYVDRQPTQRYTDTPSQGFSLDEAYGSSSRPLDEPYAPSSQPHRSLALTVLLSILTLIFVIVWLVRWATRG